jgi:hypothetical protein
MEFFISLLPLFWNNEGILMESPCHLCVCVSPTVNFGILEPIFIHFSMGVIESWAHAVAWMVEALCYKPEICGFEIR